MDRKQLYLKQDGKDLNLDYDNEEELFEIQSYFDFFPLKRGVLNDIGARYKKHHFESQDGWFFSNEKLIEFWTIDKFKVGQH